MRRFLAWIFISLLSSRALSISTEEFRDEIREHRARVLLIAQEMLKRYPETFPALVKLGHGPASVLLAKYMVLHDLPKLMTREQLLNFGLDRGDSFFDELREHYGSCQAPPCTKDLNTVEEELKSRLLGKSHMSFPMVDRDLIWTELELIERASDVLDTKLHRSRELGFRPEDGAAFRFLDAVGELKAAILAEGLETWAKRMKIQRDQQSLARVGSCLRASSF